MLSTQFDLLRGHKLLLYSLLAAFCAGYLLWFLTPHGLGTNPDTAVFIGTARNVLEGRGFAYQNQDGELAAMTHFPPLYPLLLATSAIGDGDVVHGARWLNILLLGLLVITTTYTAFYLLRSLRLALLTAILMAGSYSVVKVYLMALSEAPFLCLLLVAILCLVFYRRRPRLRYLVVAAVSLSLATMVRYAGVAAVVAAVACLLLLPGRSLRGRLRDATLLGVIGLLPLLMWFARNQMLVDGDAARAIAFHPITLDRLYMGIGTIAGWMIPGIEATRGWAVIFVFVGVSMITAVACWVSPRDTRLGEFIWITALFNTVYIVFLVVSLSVADMQTPLDYRILAPAFVPWLISFVGLLKLLGERWLHVKYIRLAPMAPALIMLIFNLQAIVYIGSESRTAGLGYANREWADLSILQHVAELPEKTTVYSNAPDLIYLYTERYSRFVPHKYAPTTGESNPDYTLELAAMQEALSEKTSVLIYFDWVERDYVPTLQELDQQLSLKSVTSGKGGVVLDAQ